MGSGPGLWALLGTGHCMAPLGTVQTGLIDCPVPHQVWGAMCGGEAVSMVLKPGLQGGFPQSAFFVP